MPIRNANMPQESSTSLLPKEKVKSESEDKRKSDGKESNSKDESRVSSCQFNPATSYDLLGKLNNSKSWEISRHLENHLNIYQLFYFHDKLNVRSMNTLNVTHYILECDKLDSRVIQIIFPMWSKLNYNRTIRVYP